MKRILAATALIALAAGTAVATPTLDGTRTGADNYRTGLNAAAGIDTNVNNGFGTSMFLKSINVTADTNDLFVFVEGSFHSGNRLFILIDSDNDSATGVVDPGPGTFGETNALAFFNQLPGGGGYDTVVVLEATGSDPGSGLGLIMIAYNAAGSVVDEKYFGNGGTSVTFFPNNNNPAGTFRGANLTASAAYQPGNAANDGIEVRIPRSFLLTNPTDGQVKVAAIGGNGGNNFWSDSAIPQLAASGNIGFTPGPDQARFSGTAPIFDVPNAYTGSGTYIVGVGGDYPTLSAFVDAATGVRELSGTIAVAAAATTVTGTGTSFLSQVQVGDAIMFSTGTFRGTAQYLTVTAVGSDTNLTVATGPTAAVTAAKPYRLNNPSSFPRTLTGNVTALIASNITEPVNTSLVLNTGSHSLTFKPYPGKTPTVTFARDLDQDGFSGDFIIGTIGAGANSVVASTDNIIIDGSNTVGGTTRDMTWTSAKTHGSSVPLHINGGADNAQVRNMNIINAGTSTGANTSGIRINSVQYVSGATAWDGFNAGFAPAGAYTPTNYIIENNAITATTVGQGHGININQIGTFPAGTAQNGFVIRNNDINARIRGVFINAGYGYTIEDNRITIGVDGVTTLDSWGIFQNATNTPPAYTTTVRNNRIFVTHAGTANNGPTGIALLTSGAGYDRLIQVYNNEVVVENTGARAAAATAPTRGMHLTSGISYQIHNNSVWIQNNPAQLGPGAITNLHGIGGFAVPTSNIEILNNVVVADLPGVAAISQNTVPAGAGSGWVSNYNTLSVSNGATVGKVTTNPASDLTAWRTATAAFNGDLQSDSFDPKPDFTDTTAPGFDLTLNAASRTVARWGAPTTALATTDFQGDARGTLTYRGFDHLAAPLSLFEINTLPATISFDESEPINYLAATLSTDDTDPLATYTYSLVAGPGDTDNGSFAIVSGNELRTTATLTPGSKSIRVRISDGGSLFAEEIISITVTPTVNVQDWMMLVD